jgi:hypothetical protein
MKLGLLIIAVILFVLQGFGIGFPAHGTELGLAFFAASFLPFE